MTGKLADTVMSVRNGEQIARKYQPVVFNPSTPAQVAQRAKLKLLSQLSAVMAPVIAMRRVGSVSARNLFTKVNFGATTFADNEASIVISNVKLTSSVVALPSIGAVRGENVLNFALGSFTTGIDRVVYAAFAKQADESLLYLGSATGSTAPTFDASLAVSSNAEIVVLAYGVRDNTENARAVFGNLEAPTAEDVAQLVVSSTLTEADVTLTETRGFTLAAVTSSSVAPLGDENRSSKKK